MGCAGPNGEPTIVPIPKVNMSKSEGVEVYGDVDYDPELEAVTHIGGITVLVPTPIGYEGVINTSFSDVIELVNNPVWGRLTDENLPTIMQGKVGWGTYGNENVVMEKANITGKDWGILNIGISHMMVNEGYIDANGMVFVRGKEKVTDPGVMALQDAYLTTDELADPEDIRYFIPTNHARQMFLPDDAQAEVYVSVTSDPTSGRTGTADTPLIQHPAASSLTLYSQFLTDPKKPEPNYNNGVPYPLYTQLGGEPGAQPYSYDVPPVLNRSLNYEGRLAQLIDPRAVHESIPGLADPVSLAVGVVPPEAGIYKNDQTRVGSFPEYNYGNPINPGDSKTGLQWTSLPAGTPYTKPVILMTDWTFTPNGLFGVQPGAAPSAEAITTVVLWR